MKNLVNQLTTFTLVKTLIYIVLGLLIVINPALFFTSITYIITGYLAILGIINIFQAIRLKDGNSIVNSSFIVGCMYLLFALIVLLFAKGIASFLPIFLGVLIVLNGLLQFNANNNSIREVNPRFRLGSMIYSGILVVAGLLIIFNPFGSLLLLFRIFGGILIFMGVSEITSYFILKRNGVIRKVN